MWRLLVDKRRWLTLEFRNLPSESFASGDRLWLTLVFRNPVYKKHPKKIVGAKKYPPKKSRSKSNVATFGRQASFTLNLQATLACRQPLRLYMETGSNPVVLWQLKLFYVAIPHITIDVSPSCPCSNRSPNRFAFLVKFVPLVSFGPCWFRILLLESYRRFVGKCRCCLRSSSGGGRLWVRCDRRCDRRCNRR